MAQNDGGPAFPVHEQWNEWSDLKADYTPKTGPRGGMSLRDYFAGQVLAGVMANQQAQADLLQAEGDGLTFIARTAGFCYGLADAMLQEREIDARGDRAFTKLSGGAAQAKT